MNLGGIAMLLAVAPGVGLSPQSPVEQGRAVAVEAGARAGGFGDLSAELRMVIRNGRGGERTRELTVATLEVAGDGERTLVRFEAPRDLRGTALLTVNHDDGSSGQWLYLPALRRTKRIVGAKRSGSFMGSEFSYEDLGTMEVDRYTYRLIGSAALDGLPAWIVERRPRDPSSQYSRHRVWFDWRAYRVLRIDFYDRSDTLLKTLRLRGFKQYKDRFWRPDEMEMTNHRTGASTVLHWSNYILGAGLARHDFEPKRFGRRG